MNVEKYKSYSITDFIQDEDFIRWVTDPKKTDEEFWHAFMLSNVDKSLEVEEAKAILMAMASEPSHPRLSMKEKTAMLDRMKGQLSHPVVRPIRLWRRIAAVAAILLIGLTTWTWLYLDPNIQTVIVTTGYGEQKSIELPDGSLVKLNANSTLAFAEIWEDHQDRKVDLQGEAFFEVMKKQETGQKFQVITKDLTVEVLGTIFNVNSHQEQTKVFLEEGKVQLNLNGLEQNLLMEPGELVAYAGTKNELPEKVRVIPTLHTSWKDGLILFDNTSLSKVLEKLEEVYGVTILAKDTANYSREITTGVPVGNLDEALSLLEMTLGLKIEKEENNFILQ